MQDKRTEADAIREAHYHDPLVSNEDYGRMIEDAHERHEAQLLEGETEPEFYAMSLDETATFEQAFEAEAGALVHRDGYLVAAVETSLHQRPVELDGGIVVCIADPDEIPGASVEGSRETDIPSIRLSTEAGVTMLTWRQARALSVAIARVEGIARNG